MQAEAIETRVPVLIREATEADFPAIEGPWMTSYQKVEMGRCYVWGGKAVATPIDFAEYNIFQRRRIRRLISAFGATVAADIEDPSFVIGWLCGHLGESAACVHYIHVKEAFRNRGVGRRLMDELEPRDALYYTHATSSGSRYMERFGGIFNPYLLEV